MKLISFLGCSAVLTLGFGPVPALAQHSDDIWIGRSGAGQLNISPQAFVPQENYVVLMPIDGPPFFGWGDNDPGFDHVVADDLENDVVVLEPGAEIWLEVVAIDPAFRVIDQGLQFLDAPGDDTFLGDETVHIHVTWHINSDDPEFDENQCVWHATFILRDEGSTDYADSEPLTFRFTNVDLSFTPGDFDGDGDVDLDDYAAFEDCMEGPHAPPDPAAATCAAGVQCLVSFDFDGDDDVDLADFAAFQEVFTE